MKIDGEKDSFDTTSAIRSFRKDNSLKFRCYNNFM